MDNLDLTRILRALRRCEQGHFFLFFVRCNSSLYCQAIVNEIQASYQQPIVEISVKDLQSKYDLKQVVFLDEALREELTQQPADVPIFIYDLEVLLPNPDKPQNFEKSLAFQTLQQLNWRRSAYQRLNRGVFFWLPEYALQLLATKALDFFDWRSAVYEFDIPETEKSQYIQQDLKDFNNNSAVHAANRMSVQEKQRWLKVLFSLRDEAPPQSAELARLLGDIGRLYYSLGDLDLALNNYLKSLEICQEIGDKKGEGTTLNNLSQIYHAKGDYETTLCYLQQSLAIQQEIGDKKGEGATLNNISQIYHDKGDHDAALRYLQQSLTIRQEIGDKKGEGATLNNISQIYKARGDYDIALRYLQQSSIIVQEIGDKSGEGTTLNNISEIYWSQGDHDTALRYLQQSLAIQQEIGDVAGLCATLFNMGHIHLRNEETDKANAWFVEAYQIAKKIGYAQVLQALDELAKELGQDGLAFWEKLSNTIN
jgi:tetratricopeptide (TPR) repeat protein